MLAQSQSNHCGMEIDLRQWGEPAPLKSQSNHCGMEIIEFDLLLLNQPFDVSIEPLWNGNHINPLKNIRAKHCLNRTIVEWKSRRAITK